MQLPEGKHLRLPLDSLHHVDYAVTATLHAAQGSECKLVLAHMESTEPQFATQSAFYTLITRAETQVTLYTDDKAACLATIEHHTGQKLSALEALGGLPESPFKTFKRITRTPNPFGPVQYTLWPTSGVTQPPQASDYEVSINQHHALFHQSFMHPLHPANISEKTAPVSPIVINEYHRRHTPKTPSKPTWDAQVIRAELSRQAETVATQLLGKPNKRSGAQLRYEKNDKLAVNVAGPFAGRWINFKTGNKGHLLDFIAERHAHFNDALEEAAALVGLSPEQARRYHLANPVIQTRTYDNTQPTPDEKERMQKARRLFQTAQPITGTLAERYLREHRGITAPLPASLRFHPACFDGETQQRLPALILAATNNQHRLEAIQTIYLDPLTAKKANVPTPKRTRGCMRLGSGVRCTDITGPHVYLAEGPENRIEYFISET